MWTCLKTLTEIAQLDLGYYRKQGLSSSWCPRNLEVQNLCMYFHGVGFYQISVSLLGQYTCGFFLLFIHAGFFLFNQQAVLPFITVGVFFYFKF